MFVAALFSKIWLLLLTFWHFGINTIYVQCRYI